MDDASKGLANPEALRNVIEDLNRELEQEQLETQREMLAKIPPGYVPAGDPEIMHYVSRMMEPATQYRGAYISNTLEVERMIDQIIVALFCGTAAQRKFFQLIVGCPRASQFCLQDRHSY